MDLNKVECVGVGWIQLAQDSIQDSCQHVKELSGSIKVGEFPEY
jgi:hypothetical protein